MEISPAEEVADEPVCNCSEPVPAIDAVPVLIRTEPLGPKPLELAVCIEIAPLPRAALVPEVREIAPPVPCSLNPPPTTNSPPSPELAFPDIIWTVPLVPDSDAVPAERIILPPCSKPYPAERSRSPPALVSDFPARIVRSPAEAVEASPVSRIKGPLSMSPYVAPVETDMDPDAPREDDPDDSVTSPEFPEVEDTVVTAILPEEPSLCAPPDVISTDPPVESTPPPVLPPERIKSAPSATSESPPFTSTCPGVLRVLSPDFNIALPLPPEIDEPELMAT